MKFRKYFRESKQNKLDKVINLILQKYKKELTESSCFDILKSAISEFIEISEFKKIIDPRKKGITINGEFRGGDIGSKHIIMKCNFDLKEVIKDLNNNLDRINDSL